MTVRDIYLTGRDIYFQKGLNFVTNYQEDYYYAKGARTLKVEEECSRRRSNEN